MNAGSYCDAAYICNMTVVTLLLAVLAVVVVGAMLLIGAHSVSIQIAKWLESFIDTAT
jgi:uncharacterized membrane protein